MKYVNHSGGCEGADMAWETVGLSYNVKTIAYSFEGHRQYSANPHILTIQELTVGWEACKKASWTLGRRIDQHSSTYTRKLLSRNWFQVKNAEAIYAIGTLVKGSGILVNGGTGWAVQMAIDNKKPVYLFEQDEKKWMTFDYEYEVFDLCKSYPTINVKNFAGIGTRAINDDGLQAILNVYEKTFL